MENQEGATMVEQNSGVQMSGDTPNQISVKKIERM